ncbi:MAG TPA: VirB8/TrbF family protein, partial [Rhodoblastus sp.]|nr:VirB8/TrbF family protein [Rhodoblastus sp.]
MRRSRAGAWGVAAAALTLAVLALAALVMLLPLKTFEPYMIVVDKTTGFTEIARALDMSGKLDQKNALTVA